MVAFAHVVLGLAVADERDQLRGHCAGLASAPQSSMIEGVGREEEEEDEEGEGRRGGGGGGNVLVTIVLVAGAMNERPAY